MKPSIGRIVHYINGHGKHLASVIVAVHSETMVNLQSFTDLTNDGETQSIKYNTSVEFAEPAEKKEGTWHWPEREE